MIIGSKVGNERLMLNFVGHIKLKNTYCRLSQQGGRIQGDVRS